MVHELLKPCWTMLLGACVALAYAPHAEAQMFSDTFETFHDYSGGDVTGTGWDGVLNPDHLLVGQANGVTPGGLRWSATPFSGWEFALDDGPVLYKDVTGDFCVTLQVLDQTNVAWSDGGLMVRVPDLADAGPGEDWVGERYFLNAFNSTRSIDGGSTVNIDSATLMPWLRISRDGARFTFATAPAADGPWSIQTILDRPDMGAVPTLQVGIWFAAFTDPAGNGNIGFADYDNFSVATTVPPAVPEPSTAALLLAGMAMGVAAIRRRLP